LKHQNQLREVESDLYFALPIHTVCREIRFEVSELAALRAGSVSLGVKLVDHEDRLELCSSNDFRAASIPALGRRSASSLSCFAEKTAKG
jgi:hypothetical protein